MSAKLESFDVIWQRASQHKGGDAALNALLPPVLSAKQLAEQPNAYFLSLMAKQIFKSGFVWRIVDKKWPEFETAFYGFDSGRLMMLDEQEWDAYKQDTRIIRHPQKILAVRDNAAWILEISAEYGSFGQWVAHWPSDNLYELWLQLKKHGARLGGMTGQYFLAAAGKDVFILTKDVVLALQNAGLDVSSQITAKRDLIKAQEAFNYWQQESGLPYRHLSKVLAFSIGDSLFSQ